MCILAEVGNQDGLAKVLGLVVYGIILLPHLNDYINLAATYAFLATLEVEIKTLKEQYQALVSQHQLLKHENIFWEDRFRKIIWLANQALLDIPDSLQKANAMVDIFKAPVEITSFLDLCNDAIQKLKALVRQQSNE
ncbi:hypothetical protein CR513_30716, partial [Mucuna pruriens]